VEKRKEGSKAKLAARVPSAKCENVKWPTKRASEMWQRTFTPPMEKLHPLRGNAALKIMFGTPTIPLLSKQQQEKVQCIHIYSWHL